MRKRTRARVIAHQFLFQHAGGGLGTKEQYRPRVSKEAGDPAVATFALELIDGCLEQWDTINREAELASHNWSVDRMNASDLNVLRLAIYELMYRPDVPPPVVINEAIELAKRFGTAESGAFVNGILDRVARKLKSGNRKTSPGE